MIPGKVLRIQTVRKDLRWENKIMSPFIVKFIERGVSCYPYKFSKHLEDRIFELKVELDNKTSRSLYFYEKEQMIIFTNGFIKKSQKLPGKELKKAKIIRRGYQND